jgi:hypothetical protein
MIKEKLEEKIVVYKNILPQNIDILKDLEEIFDSYDKDFVRATINNHEYIPELRSCTVFSLFTDNSESHLKEYQNKKINLNNKINKGISLAVIDYIKEYNIKLKEKECWEILRYKESQKLAWHSDDGEVHPCLISFVYYINDDYEGGEIEFKEKLDGIPYKPEANSLIIFPSSSDYTHRVLPITKGTKYAGISFAR